MSSLLDLNFFAALSTHLHLSFKIFCMKKILLLFSTALAFAACNDSGTGSSTPLKDSTTASATPAAMNYPYTIKQPDNWETGSSENTMVALSALKNFETGDLEKSLSYFADSVHVQFDGLDTTMSNDSLKAMLTKWRNGFKAITVKMDDWESVISKDKKQEWVTLWYRQKWEDTKGHQDSTDIVDDLNIKNGKIARLDEYTRKLH